MADVRKEKRSGMAYCLTTRRCREVVGCFRHQHCCASIFGEPNLSCFFCHRLSPAGGSQCENQNSKTTHRRLAAAARPLAARTTLAPPSKTLARNRQSCTGAEATKGRAPGFAPGRATVS